jgi:hypothetical protein
MFNHNYINEWFIFYGNLKALLQFVSIIISFRILSILRFIRTAFSLHLGHLSLGLQWMFKQALCPCSGCGAFGSAFMAWTLRY